MPVKSTPTPKNKGKKAEAQFIDYEAKVEGDDSGEEELTIVEEPSATWQTDSPVSSVPNKQLDSENRKRDLQEMESNTKKYKKRRMREKEIDYESDGEPAAQSASSASFKEKIKATREEN